jgi:hypothetical protein
MHLRNWAIGLMAISATTALAADSLDRDLSALIDSYELPWMPDGKPLNGVRVALDASGGGRGESELRSGDDLSLLVTLHLYHLIHESGGQVTLTRTGSSFLPSPDPRMFRPVLISFSQSSRRSSWSLTANAGWNRWPLVQGIRNSCSRSPTRWSRGCPDRCAVQPSARRRAQGSVRRCPRDIIPDPSPVYQGRLDPKARNLPQARAANL